MEQLRLRFLQECTANLELVSRSLDASAAEPSSNLALKDIFRGVHSIKGGAGFFDLDRIGHLAAAMEAVCGALASGTAAMTDEVISTLYKCADCLSDLTKAAELGIELVAGYEGEVLGRLAKVR